MTCSLEIVFLVLYQYEQRNHLDIFYSFEPRDQHRLSRNHLTKNVRQKIGYHRQTFHHTVYKAIAKPTVVLYKKRSSLVDHCDVTVVYLLQDGRLLRLTTVVINRQST